MMILILKIECNGNKCNNQFILGIRRSPYEAMFGHAPRALSDSFIPRQLLENVSDEEELQDLLKTLSTSTVCHASVQQTSDSTHDELPEPNIDNTPEQSSDDVMDVDSPIPPPARFDNSVNTDTVVTLEQLTTMDEPSASTAATNDPHTVAQSTDIDDDNGPCMTCGETCYIAEDALCHKCNGNLHPRCAALGGDRTQGATLICHLCSQKGDIDAQRSGARSCLEDQASRMKTSSNKRMKAIEVGDTVVVPIPDVDRGKSDAKSLLALVLSINSDMLYELGTKHGIIDKCYARSQIGYCKRKMLTIADVKMDVRLPLRTLAGLHSVSGRTQGHKHCVCTSKCQTKHCGCFKRKVFCGSRCHRRHACKNK